MSSRLSALSASSREPPSTGEEPSYTRRRRTSVSGKLLSLFGPKPKPPTPASPPAPARPVISRPQPLERRAATSSHNHVQARPSRRKRDCRDASLDGDGDENAEAVGGFAQGKTGRRATSRPRLDSTASSHTIRPSRPDAAPTSPTRPLKSALKKSAPHPEQDDAAAAAPARTRKSVFGAGFGRARAKAALNATTEHNRVASATLNSAHNPLATTLDKGQTVAGISCMPFPSSSHISAPPDPATTPATAAGRPRLTKTVTFADQHNAPDSEMPVGLKRSRAVRDLSDTDDSWADLAAQIDELGPVADSATATPTPSAPSSPSTPVQRLSINPRRQPDRSPPIPPSLSRAHTKPVPLAPQLTGVDTKDTLRPSIGKRKAVDAPQREDFRSQLARHAQPTPEVALKAAPFKLPPWTGPAVQKGAVPGKPALEKENKRVPTASMLDEVLRDLERDREERERGRAVAKPVFSVPPGRPSVLKRFTIDIVPGERHTTIWDGNDSDVFAWPGTLKVVDAKPASYFYPRHAIHDFWIQFHTTDEPRDDPVTFEAEPACSKHEWKTAYSGYRIPTPASGAPVLDPARGIAVEGECRLQPNDPDGPCTWLVHFWVPAPMRLFARAEHRTFVCRAKVTVKDWETPKTVVPAGCVAVGMERLRTDRLLAASPSRFEAR